jgi:hypothetical protein
MKGGVGTRPIVRCGYHDGRWHHLVASPDGDWGLKRREEWAADRWASDEHATHAVVRWVREHANEKWACHGAQVLAFLSHRIICKRTYANCNRGIESTGKQ